jgi:hypothetical protein
MTLAVVVGLAVIAVWPGAWPIDGYGQTVSTSCLGRYHTDRQPGVDGLVYVLAIAVAGSIGAAVRAGRFGG